MARKSPEPPNDFGKNLRAAREAKHWTQKRLATEIGVPDYNVSNWETRGGIPSLDTINLLEKNTLGVTGILSPHAEFLANNGLQNTYPGISLIRLTDIQEQIPSIIQGVQKFTHYSLLNHTLPRVDLDHQVREMPYELKNPNFVERIRQREVDFCRVEVFFTAPRFVLALFSAKDLLHTGYQVNFYLKPPTSIPTINYWSFDDRMFLTGGYREKGPPTEKSVLLIERKEPLASFLMDYWNTLWGNSTELWDHELKNAESVAESLNLTEEWSKIKRAIFHATTYERLIKELPEVFPQLMP